MLSGDALGEPALKSKEDVHRIMDKLGPDKYSNSRRSRGYGGTTFEDESKSQRNAMSCKLFSGSIQRDGPSHSFGPAVDVVLMGESASWR